MCAGKVNTVQKIQAGLDSLFRNQQDFQGAVYWEPC